ncbi:MAG: VanZ family protein [Zoogloea sp.]|nr:VanZ family protein [Zoogloea sp.]MBN8464101.1 VanZ family protein [Dechloromonas sp.]
MGFRKVVMAGRWSVHLLFVVLIIASLILTSTSVRYVVKGVFIPVAVPAAEEGATVLAGAPVVAFGAAGLSLSALNPAGIKALGWSARPSAGAVAFRVHGSVRAVGVSLRDDPKGAAQIAVLQIKNEGRSSSKVLLALSGSAAADFEEVILLRPDAGSVVLMARLVRVSGELLVKNLRLEWLAERESALWASRGLMLVWGLVLILLARSWAMRARSPAGLLVALIVVLWGVLMPGDVKNGLDRWVCEMFAWQPDDSIGVSWSSLTHGAMFFVLGGILAVVRPDQRGPLLLIDLLFLAVSTEVLQLFVEGRKADVADGAIDFLGALIGIGLVRLVRRVGNQLEYE